MTQIESIAHRATSLLRDAPEGAAVGICLAGGGTEFVRPSLDPLGMSALLMRSGIYRGEQRRPEYDLRVDLGERDGRLRGSIERITGVAFLETIPDPTDFLGSFEAETLDQLAPAMCRALGEKLPGIEFAATTMRYRQSSFAQQNFSADRGKSQNRGLARLIHGTTYDTEVSSFVDGAVARALAWSPEGRHPEGISLWFTINGECLQTIYCQIDIRGSNFVVSANDHARWPWKDKCINAALPTAEAARAVISKYIEKAYRFDLKSLEVFFAWSEDLTRGNGQYD